MLKVKQLISWLGEISSICPSTTVCEINPDLWSMTRDRAVWAWADHSPAESDKVSQNEADGGQKCR